MAKFFLMMVCLMAVAIGNGWAQDIPPALRLFAEQQGNIKRTTVRIQVPKNVDGHQPTWELTPVQTEVLFGQLLHNTERDHPNDAVFAQVKGDAPTYQGVRVVMQTYDGATIGPVIVFNGKVTDGTNGKLLRKDPGRVIELWLFGTTIRRKDQMLATQVMPIFTFEQCRLLGNLIVASDPRQCLLPDNNILLETDDVATVESLKIRTFDDCLLEGESLIDTFPRRCVAAGGRVFTEPPRLGGETGAAATPDVSLDEFLLEYRAEHEGKDGLKFKVSPPAEGR